MAILKNFNQFLSIFLDTLRAVGRGRIWLVLLGYAAVIALGLLALYRCFTPVTYPFSRAVLGLASTVGGWNPQAFYQYPGQFLILPVAHSWFKVVVAILFEGLILGTAALMFHRYYTGSDETTRKSRSLWSSWGHFILASLLLNFLLIVLSFVPGFFQTYLEGNPRRQMIFELAVVPFVYAVLQGLFFFVIPAIALYGETIVQALGRSFRAFIRRPLTCFFLATAALALPTLVSLAANHPDVIIEKFHPELVYWVLLIGVAADMVFNFLWIGTAVRYLVDEES
ncbi:hypothetical protein C3F09_00040 [candidate division GN15 bacterium]|uniref:Uncharacterized protein n=1 Tax=candidate division GN15 bacterium TaxID=2072418 RepID=A0A855X6Y2_9BACT|nr:MAG: hypothetical protein C3F09_00040 [candidate division GN15 bacterium]